MLKDTPVIETTILARTDITDADGRRFAVLEIAADGFDFLPGQFVMIRFDTVCYQWSYPHLVLKKTAKGFKVAVSAAARLYAAKVGHPVLLWGANGRGLKLEPGATLVAEPATYFLLAPIATAAQGARLISIGGAASPLDGEALEATPAADAAAAAKLLAETTGPVIMALNPATLLAVMKDADAGLAARTTVFASTDIGCGMGACMGCYLHDPEVKVGFPVCCEGPYLPYGRIDFETDINCFRLFE